MKRKAEKYDCVLFFNFFCCFLILIFVLIFGTRYGYFESRLTWCPIKKDKNQGQKEKRKGYAGLPFVYFPFPGTRCKYHWKNSPNYHICNGSEKDHWKQVMLEWSQNRTFLVAFETRIHGQAIPGANSDEPGECPHRWLPAPQRRNEVFEDGLTRAHPRQPLQVTMGYGDTGLIDVRWGIRGIARYLPMGTPSVAWIQCRSKMWCRKLKGR